MMPDDTCEEMKKANIKDPNSNEGKRFCNNCPFSRCILAEPYRRAKSIK